jgi:hypothetical protein
MSLLEDLCVSEPIQGATVGTGGTNIQELVE